MSISKRIFGHFRHDFSVLNLFPLLGYSLLSSLLSKFFFYLKSWKNYTFCVFHLKVHFLKLKKSFWRFKDATEAWRNDFAKVGNHFLQIFHPFCTSRKWILEGENSFPFCFSSSNSSDKRKSSVGHILKARTPWNASKSIYPLYLSSRDCNLIEFKSKMSCFEWDRRISPRKMTYCPPLWSIN